MPERDETVFRDTLFRVKKRKGGFRVIETPHPPLEAPIADTHAHLDMLTDVAVTLVRSAAHNIRFICSMVDVHEDAYTAYDQLDAWYREAESIRDEIAGDLFDGGGEEEILADASQLNLPRIRNAIGCHPHCAKHYDERLEALLIERLHDERTAAVGEVGLDYHYDFSPREVQREVFRRQIRLAHLSGLPLILHLREAHDDALVIMEEEGFPSAGTLLHCFNLDEEVLMPWVERGCFIALGGPLTFKKSDATRAAALRIPLSKLLTETDSPFMTPEPMRGMTCGPEHTIYTAQKLAEVWGCAPGAERKIFLEEMYRNACNLLDRPPTAWQQNKEGIPHQSGV